MKARASGIELCRVLAMLVIVAGHFIWQSGLGPFHADSAWVQFFGSGARWGVNLFLVIGCWFMVDSGFKAERLARLYLTVLFYTVPLTVLGVVFGNPAAKDVARGFLPFLGRPLWFVSAYLSLALVAPWLKPAFKLERKSLGLLVALLTLVIPGICTLPDPQMCYVVDVLFFFYVFLLVGFLKPWLASAGKFRHAALAAGIALYAMLVVLKQKGFPSVQGWAGQCLADFKTLPNLASALLVFCFFLHLDLGSIGWINRVASAAFAVYAIHQTPAFYDFLWKGIFQTEKWMASGFYPLHAAGVVAAVYLSGVVLEFPRRLIVDKWLLPRPAIQKWLKKIDGAFVSFSGGPSARGGADCRPS